MVLSSRRFRCDWGEKGFRLRGPARRVSRSEICLDILRRSEPGQPHGGGRATLESCLRREAHELRAIAPDAAACRLRDHGVVDLPNPCAPVVDQVYRDLDGGALLEGYAQRLHRRQTA